MATLASIAHDQKKNELLEGVKEHRLALSKYKLIGTGSTADLVNSILDLRMESFGRGPQGGDILLAAKILMDKVHRAVFSWTYIRRTAMNTTSQHLFARQSATTFPPIALNRSSADFMVRAELRG